MRRVALWFAVLLAVVGLAGMGGVLWGRHTVETMLDEQGWTWESRSGWHWNNLRRPGIDITTLGIQLTPDIGATAQGITIHLDQLAHAPNALDTPAITTASSPLAALPLNATVQAENVTVMWEDIAVVTALSGSLWPDVNLHGVDSAVRRGGDGWDISFPHVIDEPHLTGTAQVRLSGDDPLHIDVRIDEAVLAHEVLAETALPAQPMMASMTWHRATNVIDGQCSLGGVAASFHGSLTPQPLAMEVTIDATTVALVDVIALFGDLIPEAARADIRGALTATAHLQGPPWTWDATVSAENLAAGDVIDHPGQLQYGRFSWLAPAADGGRLVRETGEGHPTWTPLREGMLMAQAAIAAEDARFRSHSGYDMEGINAALTELSSGIERPRGGSTITQQLAKNLFLSGERTLARKARELLYALELERVLGKERILELYINVVEFGPRQYGVRTASDVYFLKQPQGLAPQEAAFLAAILPSPRSWYTRVASGAAPPKTTVNRILGNMVNTGALDSATARWAQREPLVIIPPVD